MPVRSVHACTSCVGACQECPHCRAQKGAVEIPRLVDPPSTMLALTTGTCNELNKCYIKYCHTCRVIHY